LTTQEILKQYWGYDQFRPLQQDIINAVLDGKDTLALLPTGGGKSICFQVPAMAKDGICLVISPLIALMKDQVENLKRKGIPALAVYSGMSFLEVKKTLQNAAYGNYKFLYVSPERLQTNLFLEYLPAMKVNLLAVDEAHCISQWGYDFRPPYLHIAALKEYLPKVPILALTASATKQVQDDICEKLQFTQQHHRFQQSFERANLSYSVFNTPAKQNKLLEIIRNVPGSAIVYCRSRRHTKEVSDLLKLHQISADFYHAGLSNEERSNKQESWINNKIRVMCCTNAFGMGIDKPNVRVVVHYDVPDCLENYYQEAGRAGRDGKRAYAVLLYNDHELEELQLQVNSRYPSPEEIKTVYTALMNHLQVAAGGGVNASYNFDLTGFCNAFKLNIVTANYAIKTLEQEEILTFNEAYFKPSSVVFTCTKEELESFEKDHPQYEPIIKSLLRSYEGIFDFPAAINETRLAKMTAIKDAASVPTMLTQIQQFGILSYEPQKDKPQITLLKNRMYADSFLINLENHLKRKKHFEERLKDMIGYIRNRELCRGKIIASYFGDDKVKNCGICDNCINNNLAEITPTEFAAIEQLIRQALMSSPASIKDLVNSIKSVNKTKLWRVVEFLQAENKITVDPDGTIRP